MSSRLEDGFAIYPMVEEQEATGVVAAVYAALLDQMPFVPSLFKSLALCPGYLVLAYEQAAGVLDDDGFAAAGRELAGSVASVAAPPEQPDAREILARFVDPLGRMLLLSSGLLLAVSGQLDVPPAPGRAPTARPVAPKDPQPSQWAAPAPELYGQVRASLQTPLVNTIWRTLAHKGQLEAAWSVLGPQVRSTRAAADALQRRSIEAAPEISWTVAATPAALDAAGVADASPGIAAVLDAYVKTLPRILVLAASSGRG